MALPIKKWHIIFDCDGTLLDTSSYPYQVFSGIRELLLELSEFSHLYVWTARDKVSMNRFLSELGLISFFDEFSNPEDGHPKPHSLGLKQLVGDAPKDFVFVIGDSSADILGAKNFGVRSIGVIWNKAAKREFLKEAGADFIVSHPSECSKIIRQK